MYGETGAIGEEGKMSIAGETSPAASFDIVPLTYSLDQRDVGEPGASCDMDVGQVAGSLSPS